MPAQPTCITRKILIAACCCLIVAFSGSVFSAEGGGTTYKLAVLAVVSDEGQSETLKMAEGVYRKLLTAEFDTLMPPHEKYEVLPVDEVRRLLAGTGTVGAPTEDLERLRGLYQDGYLKSYSFKCEEAVEKFKAVMKGLENAPDSPARWNLYVKTNIYMGKSYLGLKKKKEAMEAFKVVLRTRPKMSLSKKEHPVKDIKLWKKALAGLDREKKGKLVLDTEPSGTLVFLDGEQVGVTPFIGSYPGGRYHLRLYNKETGLSHSRWIKVKELTKTFRFNLFYESSLLTGLTHPAIKTPEGNNEVPFKWWPWISERLGMSRAATIRMVVDEGKQYWEVSLVDAGNGEDIRECRVEHGSADKDTMAVNLAKFLVTGQLKDGMVLTVRTKDEWHQHENPARLKIKPGIIVTEKTTPPSAPWYRNWWPYAVCGAVLLGGGVAANLVANDYYDNPGGLASRRDAADTWMGVAIGGYVLAGVSIILGIVLDATRDEGGGSQALVPVARTGEMGLIWFLRF